MQARPSNESCISALQSNVDTTETKFEQFIIRQAVSAHYNKTDITESDTQQAIVQFIKYVDPFNILLSDSEIEFFERLPKDLLSQVHNEVFKESTRNFHAKIMNIALERLSHIIQKFTKEKEYRDRAFQRALELKEANIENKISLARPQSIEDLEDAFVELFARNMVLTINNSSKKDFGYAKSLSDREAFVITIRSFRSEILAMVSEVSEEMLPLLIAKSYITNFDPHSDLHLPREALSKTSQMEGESVGIGASLLDDFNGLKVTRVHKNSPSYQVGIKEGDVITHVISNEKREELMRAGDRVVWVSTRGIDSTYFVENYIKGTAGSKLLVRIVRDGKPLHFEVTRQQLDMGVAKTKVNLVETSRGKIAHIRFDVFYHGVGEDVREQLKELLEQNNISGVALDLRQNRGGAVLEVPKILGLFIKEGEVFAAGSTGRVSGKVSIDAKNEPIWTGPLIVMTDEASASASEAVAGNLKDFGRAIVVGAKSTFGKGSMQSVKSRGTSPKGEFMVRITKQLYFTPSGKSPQNVGVTSDIELPQVNPEAKFERDFENTIPETTIDSFLAINEPLIPRYDDIKLELKKRAQARMSIESGTSTNLTPREQHKKNAKDSFDVLMDLVELLGR